MTKRGTYEGDREWGDRFIPQARRWLADVFIVQATRAADCRRVTDLTLTVDNRRPDIAFRIREYEAWLRYPNEFTLRLYRENGQPTEWEKVRAGYGDYLFYGFATPDQQRIHSATLIDLNKLREAWMIHMEELAQGRKGFLHYTDKPNTDKETGFRAFKLGSCPAGTIRHQWLPRVLRAVVGA